MAEILTTRALLTAAIESTFATENPPDPATDALLVEEPDASVDFTAIERNFVRQSISQLPVAAGRKIQSFTYMHEVRGNGNLAVAPRVGRLLRGCGFAQTQLTASGTTTNGNTSTAAVAAPAGDDPFSDLLFGTSTPNPNAPTYQGTNNVIERLKYRLRVVIGGASTTAAVRITGGDCAEGTAADGGDLVFSAAAEGGVTQGWLFTETFSIETVSSTSPITGVAVWDDTTDPNAPELDLTGLGGLTIGDVFRVRVLGVPFLATVTVATPTGLGDDIETAVAAHANFTASNAAGTVTFGFTNTGSAPALTAQLNGTVLTSGATQLTLGVSGHQITVGAFTTLDLNDAWEATTKPIGWEYTPISTAFESLTQYLYFDGVLHRLTGSRGTFTVEAPGGDLAKYSFTFTGNYNAVTDVALPSATFEDQVPPQVELTKLRVNTSIDDTDAPTEPFGLGTNGAAAGSWANELNLPYKNLCAASFNIDAGNNVVPRDCINDPDSFMGVIITGRAMTGSFDPELELVASHDFWGIMSTADVLQWRARVGTTRSNITIFESLGAQYTGLSYGDRDGLRVLEVDMRFSAQAPNFSDDEFSILFA